MIQALCGFKLLARNRRFPVCITGSLFRSPTVVSRTHSFRRSGVSFFTTRAWTLEEAMDSFPVLIHNGKPVPAHGVTVKQLLQINPHGVYTTCRTVDEEYIFEFDAHIERLVKGGPPSTQGQEEGIKEEVCGKMLPSLVSGFRTFKEINPDFKGDRRITMILAARNQHSALWDHYVYVEALPPVPSPPTVVEMRVGKRSNPEVKSVQWSQERRSLQAMMAEDANEIVLLDDNGNVYEGLSSSFGVFMKEEVVTAPDDKVLLGTVMKGIITACDRQGIPVKRKLPNLRDIEEWDTAFVCSTSRLLLPIHTLRIYLKDDVREVSFYPEQCEMVAQSRQGLAALMKECSKSIAELEV